MWCCAIYRKDMKTFRDYISGVYIKIKGSYNFVGTTFRITI